MYLNNYKDINKKLILTVIFYFIFSYNQICWEKNLTNITKFFKIFFLINALINFVISNIIIVNLILVKKIYNKIKYNVSILLNWSAFFTSSWFCLVFKDFATDT